MKYQTQQLSTLLKFNNISARTRRAGCSKLKIKTVER